MPKENKVAAFARLVDSIPEDWRDEPVLALADTVEIKLEAGSKGNGVRRRESTWFYINRRNPELLAQYVIADFENIETAPSLYATAYYPDGSRWDLQGTGPRRFRSQEGEVSSSNRFLSVFSPSRYVQGMFLRVETVRHYTRPDFLKAELLRGDLCSLGKTVQLSLPPGAEIRFALLNPENLPADTARLQTPEGLVYTVSARNLDKLDSRTMPRNPEAWFAALHFSLPPQGLKSATWTELGDQYLASIQASMAVTPPMEKLAGSVSAGDPDTLAARILALLRSRIRYHSDVDKIHAFVPRPAGEVLSKGYGDCKEMSTLMALLLRKKGIKAGMALISPPGTFQVLEDFPSMGGFNHMVVYLEVPGRPIRFYDPTIHLGDPVDSYFPVIDRTALLLEQGKSRLAVVQPARGFRNRVETTSSIVRKPSGKDWMLQGGIRLDGLYAFNLLPLLESAKGDENMPFLKAYLKETFGLDASTCHATSHPDRSAVSIDYEAAFTANYLELHKGGLLVNLPSIYGGEVRYTALEFEGPRNFTQMEQSDAWELPQEFAEFQGEPLVDALGTGAWKREGGRLQRTYSSPDADIGASDRDKVSEFLKRKALFTRATVWRK